MKNIWLIALGCTFFSCSPKNINTYVLNDDELIDIFCEIHIIDAAARQGVLKNNRNNVIKYKQFKAILLKYNLERNRFDSTLIYLSQHPNKFVKLYEKVELRLVKDLKSYSESEE